MPGFGEEGPSGVGGGAGEGDVGGAFAEGLELDFADGVVQHGEDEVQAAVVQHGEVVRGKEDGLADGVDGLSLLIGMDEAGAGRLDQHIFLIENAIDAHDIAAVGTGEGHGPHAVGQAAVVIADIDRVTDELQVLLAIVAGKGLLVDEVIPRIQGEEFDEAAIALEVVDRQDGLPAVAVADVLLGLPEEFVVLFDLSDVIGQLAGTHRQTGNNHQRGHPAPPPE